MKNLKQIILMLFSCLMIAGACTNSKVTGVYIQTTKPSAANQVIELRKDSTFTYELLFDIAESVVFNGKWKVSNRILFLDENEQNSENANISSSLHEIVTNNNDKMIVVYNANDSTLIPGAEIELNNSGNLMWTNSNGAINIPKIDIKYMRIKFLMDTTFNIKNPYSNYFIVYIKINQRQSLLKSIPSKKWFIKSNSLIELDKNMLQNKYNLLKKID